MNITIYLCNIVWFIAPTVEEEHDHADEFPDGAPQEDAEGIAASWFASFELQPHLPFAGLMG